MIRPSDTKQPAAVIVLALIAVAVIAFPILALLGQVPWSRFGELASRTDSVDLLKVTLYSAVQATIISVVLGTACALALRTLQRAQPLARLVMYLPLALPPVVGGLALASAFGKQGVAAPVMEALGLQLAFRFQGVVLAHVFIALPFVIITVDAALRQQGREVARSAASVGMSRWAVLWKVVLPGVLPAVVSATGLAFARSLGEFGTTLTFAGSYPGVTRTLPIGIYLEREADREAALVLAALLMLLAVVALVLAAVPFIRRQRTTSTLLHLDPPDVDRLRELTAPEDSRRLLEDKAKGTSAPGTSQRRRTAVDPIGAREAAVEVEFAGSTIEIPRGALTAVIGPNGAGKSTLAALIAGWWRGAKVRVNGRIVDPGAEPDGPSTTPAQAGNRVGDRNRGIGHGDRGDRGRWVPAWERDVVLLTQKPGLPPHATVEQVLTMVTRDGSRSIQLLDAAGLSALRSCPVPALSGGQAAHVALLRALATCPRVLILDEPLAAIDAVSAGHWRRIFRAAATDRATILITHDAADITSLAQHLIVFGDQRVVAQGPIAQLIAMPPDDFSAQLLGLNRIEGTLRGGTLRTVGGVEVRGKDADATPASDQERTGAAAVATFAPHAVTIADQRAHDSQQNRWAARIEHIEHHGHAGIATVRMTLVDDATVTVRATVTTGAFTQLALQPGDEVLAAVKATAITITVGG